MSTKRQGCPPYTRSPKRIAAAGCIAAIVLFYPLSAAKALMNGTFWSDPVTGFALGGFDPVSYFTSKRPMRGSAKFEYEWNGGVWRFVNEGNMAAFKRDPYVYAPQFGGFGANGLANGQLSPGNPSIWTISRGRLILFYSQQGLREWLSEPEEKFTKASEQWQSFAPELDN